MRIYISCDMEGTAGIVSWMQCDPSNQHEYPIYRRYMMQEVRAAIEGARKGGAREIVINDSHWDMRNVLWDELPPDVRVITGSRKPQSMNQGMAQGFDGAIFTGYHAASGARDGVLAHTYTSDVIYNIRINGVACSETLLNAAVAGYNRVPVLMVSGDRTIVEHAQEHLPWIEGITVKDAIGYYSANSMTPKAAQSAIRQGALRAVKAARNAKPFIFAPPVVMELDVTRVEQADFIELMPGFVRTGGRTLRFEHSDFAQVFRAFLAAFRLGGAASERA